MDIDKILSTHSLKRTNTRRDILSEIVRSEYAISQTSIEKKLFQIDRVTIYRTLNTFESKGVIHKIIATDNEVRYAYCKDHCHEGEHEDNHIHFSCIKCDKTYCLDDQVPTVSVPKGYTATQVNTLVQGVCEFCNDK